VAVKHVRRRDVPARQMGRERARQAEKRRERRWACKLEPGEASAATRLLQRSLQPESRSRCSSASAHARLVLAVPLGQSPRAALADGRGCSGAPREVKAG
jgi:hypothetical protein